MANIADVGGWGMVSLLAVGVRGVEGVRMVEMGDWYWVKRSKMGWEC